MSYPESELIINIDDELVTREEFNSFVILDAYAIGKIVTNAPKLIERAEQRIYELEQERFQLHQLYKQEKARKILEARKLTGEDKLTNATDREYWATLQPSVISALDKEVACVSELKVYKAKHEYWRNIFIAARKLETRIQQENELEIQSMRFRP